MISVFSLGELFFVSKFSHKKGKEGNCPPSVKGNHFQVVFQNMKLNKNNLINKLLEVIFLEAAILAESMEERIKHSPPYNMAVDLV